MNNLKTLVILGLGLVVNIHSNPEPSFYLISTDLDHIVNPSLIEELAIPVIYQIDRTALLKVTHNQIRDLERKDVKFTILDQEVTNNSYYLAKKNNMLKNDPIISKSIGSLVDYLILKNVDDNSISELAQKYHISPLDMTSEKPFDTHLFKANPAINDIDPLITEVIEDIDRDSVEYVINRLQQFGTRFMLAPNRFEVSEWIYNQFRRFGFTNVEYDTFTAYTSINYYPVFEDTITIQRNVVATIEGSIDPGAVFIVCGHYDSFNRSTDPFRFAPGADDDASGTAAVLEMARVFMENDYVPQRTIKFIAMAAEELMNFGDGGSEHYAALSKTLDTDIRMVINHDMISHTYQSLSNSTINVNHHYTADHYADLALEKIEKYTQINGMLNDYFGADLGPFIQNGYTGIYFEESDFSPYYHTSDDVIENYSMDFCTEVIKASCATLIECATIPHYIFDFIISDQVNGTSLIVSWNPNPDDTIDHYNIYIGLSSRTYNRVEMTNETNILIDQLISGTEYYIGLSAVDSDGYESLITERSYIPYYFSLDKGILVIDETADGDGTLLKPDDDQVDAYYEKLLVHFDPSYWDIIDNEGIQLTDFGEYSTILWQADDWYDQTTLYLILDDLSRFLDAGGNLLYTGYAPCQAIAGTFVHPDTFAAGDFIYDYLKIANTEKGFGTRFYGATAESSDYFDITVDTTKTKDFSAQHLSNIESIEATEQGRNILFYDSNYDSSSIQGSMIGLPVGVEYLGNDFNVVTLSFPLYYMQQDQAQAILEYILGEKFSEPLEMKSLTEISSDDFKLFQNYPNPFNPITVISYQLPVKSDVELSVYNLLGQRVALLLSETQQSGHYTVRWDASEFASGVYFFRMETSNGFTQSKKMILLR